MIYNLLVKVLVKNNMMIVKCLQDIIENTQFYLFIYNPRFRVKNQAIKT